VYREGGAKIGHLTTESENASYFAR